MACVCRSFGSLLADSLLHLEHCRVVGSGADVRLSRLTATRGSSSDCLELDLIFKVIFLEVLDVDDELFVEWDFCSLTSFDFFGWASEESQEDGTNDEDLWTFFLFFGFLSRGFTSFSSSEVERSSGSPFDLRFLFSTFFLPELFSLTSFDVVLLGFGVTFWSTVTSPALLIAPASLDWVLDEVGSEKF